MVAVGLFVFSFLIVSEKKSFNILLKKLWPFVPGGLLAAAFLFYHWYETGWIGYHPESPWAPSYERVGGQGFIKNIGVFGWRMLDFGRVFFCAVLLLFIPFIFKNLKEEKIRQLFWLVIIVFFSHYTYPVIL